MIKLKILVASKYNDANHQAVECAVGNTLITGDAYGRSLIESGLAEQVFEEPVEAPVEEKAKEKKKSAPRKRRATEGNPFAPQ